MASNGNGTGNEMELVERVELRFALADTDIQLASAIASFLVPLIGKLSSTTPGVQAKVMQLLSHINARIKAAPQIPLPVKPLIAHLLAAPNTATIARNFSAVYLELALDRASTNSKSDRAEFAPLLLAAIPAAIGSSDPAKHPLTLKLVSLVARCATNALDFPPLSPAALAARDTLFAALTTDAEWATVNDALAYALRQPSGLPNLTNGEQWSIAKRTLISLIHWWTPADKASWARSYAMFVGTCDPVAIVADHAETTWRKNKVDMEDARLVKSVLGLYLAQPTEEETPTPGTVAVKTKVLAWVVKSKAAANAFPDLLKVVFDAMFGKGTTAKIQASGVGYLQWVARSADQSILDRIAPILVSGTLKTINQGMSTSESGLAQLTGDPRVTELAIVALGVLLQRVPAQFTPETLTTLFTLARSHPPNLKLAIQDCLTSALVPLTPESTAITAALATLLSKPPKTQATSDLYDYLSLRFTCKLLPTAITPTLPLHLRLASSQSASSLVQQEAQAGLDAFLVQPNAPPVSQVIHAVATAQKLNDISLDFIWRYVAVHACAWSARRMVPVDVFRSYTYARALRAWAQQSRNKVVVGEWMQWLANGLMPVDGWSSSSSSLGHFKVVEVCIRQLHVLHVIGGAELPAGLERKLLVERMRAATSELTQWRIRALLPNAADNAMDVDQPPQAGTLSAPHRAAELLLAMDLKAAVSVLQPDSSPGLLVQLAAVRVIAHVLATSTPAVDDALAQDAFQTLSKLVKAPSTPADLLCASLTALGWLTYRNTSTHTDTLLQLVSETIPTHSSTRSSGTTVVLTAAGESLAIAAGGHLATCIDFHLHSTGSSTLHLPLIDALLTLADTSASTASKPTRRAHLTYLDSLVTHLPTLPADPAVLRAHDLAVRALVSPELADTAARVILAVHVDRAAATSDGEALSERLMPSVSRALQMAPAAASSSRAFVVFDALVGAMREAGAQGGVGCRLVKIVAKWGMLESSAGETTAAAAAAGGAGEGPDAVDRELELPNVNPEAIVPILFRLASHPNTHIGAAAKALVKGLTHVGSGWPPLAAHLPKIFGSTVLNGLSHSAPIIRESSLLALIEAVNVDPELAKKCLSEEVCRAALKLLDDVHDSVQSAAVRACTVVCARVPPKISVPFLLDGLRSSAAPVTKFALGTLMKMCTATSAGTGEQGGIRPAKKEELLPLVPEIVSALLDALSALEPQVMNYLTFHVHKYDMSQAQLDARRLTMVQGSPVMATLESLISIVTSSADLAALTESLINTVRKGVGLPTRGGVARVILLLNTAVLRSAPPSASADPLLKSLSGAIFDANPAVRHVMAAAAAHIVGSGATSPEMVDKFLAHLKKQYATGAPEKRVMVAEVAEALVKSPGSKDLVGRIVDTWLPVAAIGKQAAKPVRDGQQQGQQPQQDADEECEADMWAAVWSAYVNVESTGIKLYGVETAQLASEWLASTQDWHLQDQLAKTLDWLIRATRSGSRTAPTTALTQGLARAISDDTLGRIVQLAMGQKREALLKGAVAVVAFKVRTAGPETSGQVAGVAREFTDWLVSEIVKASRGHPMLTDLVSQMGEGELAAHLMTQEMVDALVSTGHVAITKPSKRPPKPDVIVDMWVCFATLFARSHSSPSSIVRLSDPAAMLAVAQHACDVPARNLAVTAIHHVKQLLPMFAAQGMDLKYIVQDVVGFPAKLEATGATSGDAQMVAVAFVHLAAVAAGVPSTAEAEGVGSVDGKAVAAVRPWVKEQVDSLSRKSGLVPVVHDELVKLGKALQ